MRSWWEREWLSVTWDLGTVLMTPDGSFQTSRPLFQEGDGYNPPLPWPKEIEAPKALLGFFPKVER